MVVRYRSGLHQILKFIAIDVFAMASVAFNLGRFEYVYLSMDSTKGTSAPKINGR